MSRANLDGVPPLAVAPMALTRGCGSQVRLALNDPQPRWLNLTQCQKTWTCPLGDLQIQSWWSRSPIARHTHCDPSHLTSPNKGDALQHVPTPASAKPQKPYDQTVTWFPLGRRGTGCCLAPRTQGPTKYIHILPGGASIRHWDMSFGELLDFT